MENAKVIEKIRKVLALTKSNHDGEVQAALLKAQALLAQHGLTMAEIELEANEKDQKEVVDICVAQKQRNIWYERDLAAIICNNFRCHTYTFRAKGIYFIGLKADVEIAMEIYLYALKTMLYLAQNYVKERKSSRRGLKNDYIFGFLEGLQAKFAEQVASKGYGLVLVKDALVVQAIKQKGLKEVKGVGIIIADTPEESAKARFTGYHDGREFDQNRKLIQ